MNDSDVTPERPSGRYRITGPSKLGDQRLVVVAAFLGLPALEIGTHLRTGIRAVCDRRAWAENKRLVEAYFAAALHRAFWPERKMEGSDIPQFQQARQNGRFRLTGANATPLLLRAEVPEEWIVEIGAGAEQRKQSYIATDDRFSTTPSSAPAPIDSTGQPVGEAAKPVPREKATSYETIAASQTSPAEAGTGAPVNDPPVDAGAPSHKAQAPAAGTEKLLGASQWGAALGVDPFKSAYQLKAELTGLVEPEPAGELADLGNMLEPVIAAMFRQRNGERYGFITQPPNSLIADWRRATPDLVCCRDYEKAPHEVELWQIKCCFQRPPKYAQPPLTGRGNVPETVFAQLHGETCVLEQFTQEKNGMGYRVTRLGVVVLCFGGKPVYREYAFDVDRHYLADAAKATRIFFDGPMPQPDGSKGAARVQNLRFTEGFTENTQPALPENARAQINAAAERLRQYYQAKKQIDSELGKLRAWFREVIGNHHFVRTPSGDVKFSRPIEGRQWFDVEELLADVATLLPAEMLDKHVQASPPSRRFVPPRDWSKTDG